MVLQPGKTKFRKAQRGRMRGMTATGSSIIYGEFGLQAVESGYLKVNQIESARKALAHHVKRGGKIWVRMLADKPFTGRPAETRMGGGKGDPMWFVAGIRRGKIMFEIAGISEKEAREGFRLASFKLPIKVRMVKAQ